MVPLLSPNDTPLELENTRLLSVPEVVPAEMVADELVTVGTVYDPVMTEPLRPKASPLELLNVTADILFDVVPAEMLNLGDDVLRALEVILDVFDVY